MNVRFIERFRYALSPVRLCRLDADLVAELREDRGHLPLVAAWSVLVVAGMAVFGAAFGMWRSPWQALYGAVKMPLMLHAVVWLSVAVNAMLNWLLEGGLSLRQVRRCVMAAMAITSVVLASLAPVVAFFVRQVPAPTASAGMSAYRGVLCALVVCVGCAGVAGYARLWRLLRLLAPSRTAAWRVLVAWVLVTGLVGTQCSWLLSPFVQRPDTPVAFWNPNAFSGNFFEHLWFHVLQPWLTGQAGASGA